MAVLPGIVKSVLEAEYSYLRFEKLCLDLFYAAEGIELSPTSLTHDAGRDGRALLLRLTPSRPVLCATITSDIDDKVTHDAIRLAQTTKSDEIIYCLSKSITEIKCDSIEARIRELYPEAKSVRVFGQIQILRLIEHNEQVFQKLYLAEIRNIERALLFKDETTPDIAEFGLRLALCTQVGNEATVLRKEITKCLILNTLSEQGSLKSTQISNTITHMLHLPQTISQEYISGVLEQFTKDGLVSIDNDLITLTDSAQDYLASLSERAGVTLLEGRKYIREALQELTGNKFADLHFDKIWEVFQDGISQLFYSHGLHIIRMVRSVLDNKSHSVFKEQDYLPLEEFADRISKLVTHPAQAREIRQAVIDIFTEKDNPAFQWLTQLCSIFVMMCSLGLESLSSEQIIKTLSNYHLVPDSDIIISFLCEGEPNHEDVDRIIKGWKAVSGNIHLARPVLEEVAYHAWISDYDYAFFESDLDELSEEKAKYVIENAFVRTFKKVAGQLTARKYWTRYINQYKGKTAKDYSRIYQILHEELKFEMLPDSKFDSESLDKQLKAYMIQRVSNYTSIEPKNLDYRVLSKIERDIEIILAVHSERKKQLQSMELTTTCIISSANLLRDADFKFRKVFGEPEMVLSTAAVAFLLTLSPQVQMSFGTLRSVLFDTGLATRLNPAQRYAYRIITTSLERDLPWAKRVTLQRELTEVLLQDARAMAQPLSKLQDRFSRARDQGYVAKVTAEVIDRLALTPKSRQELIETKLKLSKAEAELETLKQSTSPTIAKTAERKIFKSKRKKPK